MASKLVLLSILASLAIFVSGEEQPTQESKVVKLTDDTFESKTKEGVWIVKFFAPWCGHCKKLAPTWEEYAKLATGIYNVAEIDCTVEKKTAEAHAIKGYPTIKLFEDGKLVSDVNVPRNIKDFVVFVEGKVSTAHQDIKGKIDAPAPPPPPPSPPKEPRGKTDVIILTKDTFNEKVNTGLWIVKFFAPWCGHCKKLAPIWEEFATAQKTAMEYNVGEVDCTDYQDLCTKYGVRSFPTILVFDDGKEPVKYNGERTLAALTTHMRGLLPPEEEKEL